VLFRSRQEKQIPLIKPQLSEEEARLFDLISSGPLDLDDIIVKSQSSVSAVSALLLMLQLKKLVKQLPGKQFERAQNEK
jgi:DNA processing protein